MVCYSAFKAIHQRSLPIFFMLIASPITTGLRHGNATLPGLYDRKGQAPSEFTPEQKDEIRQWAKLLPKNLNKIGACMGDSFGLDVSKQTIKRVLKSFAVSWRRIRKKVKHRPDPETYQEKREAFETLIEEDREGIIDLRYFDESGFCLVPYIPMPGKKRGTRLRSKACQASV